MSRQNPAANSSADSDAVANTLVCRDASGNSKFAGIEVTTGDVVVTAGELIITAPTTPASAAAAGVIGTIAWDTGFLYICTATNTWERVAVATW